jgi:hypothetical protein
MKYGDWHKTKEIILKGHDWVCREHFNGRSYADGCRSLARSRRLVCEAEVVLVSPLA